ncbi:MAG: glycosyltransferase [Chloroflexota bacterium]|nr:glycosyltransferase [Chloroflexota bacterium]
MTTAAEVLLWLLAAPLAGASAYLGVLAVLALVPWPRPVAPATALRRFAVVVPAHNEARTLPALLRSLGEADYPAGLVRTLVVADNCDDATAAVARSLGADAYERRDTTAVGKGCALAFGIERLDARHDAVVFVDADCTVSANLFRACNDRLAAGADVVQAYYTMRIAGASSTRLVRELALALVHRLRPLGKRWYGGSAGLKGSGMCFSRHALDRLGWTASGLAEDVEQHIRLVRQGVRVAFAPEATVTGESPAALRDAAGQHRRWEAGRLTAARREGVPLLLSALRQRSLLQLDTAIELLVPPVSLLGAAVPALLAAALLMGSAGLAVVAGAALAALAAYLLSGLMLMRPSARDLAQCAIALPRYMLWKLWLYARAATSKAGGWERTERVDPAPLAGSGAEAPPRP